MQRAYCPNCRKPFEVDCTKPIYAPDHATATGATCSGSGKVLRLVSAGLIREEPAQRNGKMRHQ